MCWLASGIHEIEMFSDNRSGLEDRFQCADGARIRSRRVCDGYKDCADGSDEDEKTCSSTLEA